MIAMNDLMGQYAQLVPMGSDQGKPALPLDRQIVIIGSGPGCRIRIKHAAVSRTHCAMIMDGPEVTICDLVSRNGTIVNKHRVDEKKLRNGDTIKIGATLFRFEDSRVNSARQPAPPTGYLSSEGMDAVKIAKRAVLIGTRENCDIIITSPEAAPVHAILCALEGKYVLRDLGFGTLLNGRSVHQQELKAGDEIDVVGVRLAFKCADVAPEAKARADESDEIQLIEEESPTEEAAGETGEDDDSGPLRMSDLLDLK